jgi:hypothetical protein
VKTGVFWPLICTSFLLSTGPLKALCGYAVIHKNRKRKNSEIGEANWPIGLGIPEPLVNPSRQVACLLPPAFQLALRHLHNPYTGVYRHYRLTDFSPTLSRYHQEPNKSGFPRYNIGTTQSSVGRLLALEASGGTLAYFVVLSDYALAWLILRHACMNILLPIP